MEVSWKNLKGSRLWSVPLPLNLNFYCWYLNFLKPNRLVFQVSSIYGPYSSDPFDRLIIAQAASDDLVIMTKDDNFSKYPVQLMWN